MGVIKRIQVKRLATHGFGKENLVITYGNVEVFRHQKGWEGEKKI